MNVQTDDVITWGMMLRKLPTVAKALPRVIRGLKLSKVKAPDQPCGLAWSFEQAVARNPSGPALLYGNRSLSYLQANQWANRIAHYLIGQGLGKGDVVGVLVDNRIELLITVLAVAKVGGVCAMLNTSQTQGALVHSITLVSPVAMVVGAELLDGYSAVREQVSVDPARHYFVADRDRCRPG